MMYNDLSILSSHMSPGGILQFPSMSNRFKESRKSYYLGKYTHNYWNSPTDSSHDTIDKIAYVVPYFDCGIFDGS